LGSFSATPIEDIDLNKVHPTFFQLHDGCLVPFELAEGPLPIAIEAIPDALFVEFAAYVAQNKLADIVALELGDFTDCHRRKDSVMAEIEVQWEDGGLILALLLIFWVAIDCACQLLAKDLRDGCSAAAVEAQI
jgi:hypothetical protein